MESNEQRGIGIENESKRSNGTVNFDRTHPTKKNGPPRKVDLIHIVIVIVIVFVIKLYHDGWSDDIDGSFTLLYSTFQITELFVYTSLISQHTNLNNNPAHASILFIF